MLLDLSKLRGGTEHVERRFEPAAIAPGERDFRVAGPVDLVADVRKDGRRVRLTGRLRATLECDCSRCLEPFAVPVDAALDLQFLSADENRGDEEREVGEDDLGVAYYTDDELDLGGMIREQFYLALPMKPVCDEGCRGLCPTCGANRNRETCACASAWVDPRMDALRKLRDVN